MAKSLRFCIFLAENGVFNTNRSLQQMAFVMSHVIHKIASKRRFPILFHIGVRRMTSKIKTVICEQAPNHGSYFAYARLIARVTLNLLNQILAHNLLLYLRISLRFQIIPKIGNSLINILRDIFRRTQLFTNSFDQIPLRRDDLHICCIKLRHIVI